MPFRDVLRLPRVASTLTLMFFARLPMTMVGVTMTLYVVTVLGRGYGAAGMVGAATTLGMALAAPLLGRAVDRYGLRPVVALCGTGSTAFWIAVPHLPYAALAVVSLPAGMLTVPAGSLARQALAALVPPPQRRSAYSLDTISVETSFMIGPTAAIASLTQISPTFTLTAIGVFFGVTAMLIYLLNPPIRREDDVRTAERPPLRSWLTAPLAGTLLIAAGTLFCLVGTEVATIAMLRQDNQVGWTGLVITVMCAASVAGGVMHGMARRSFSQGTLMLGLVLLTLPVAFLGHPWWLLALALIPTNILCAPTLAATSETVTDLAPPRVRGEAMGLQDTSTRLGLALGSPVVGFAIDHSSPAWGFVAAGLGGLVLASAGLIGSVRRRVPAPEAVLVEQTP